MRSLETGWGKTAMADGNDLRRRYAAAMGYEWKEGWVSPTPARLAGNRFVAGPDLRLDGNALMALLAKYPTLHVTRSNSEWLACVSCEPAKDEQMISAVTMARIVRNDNPDAQAVAGIEAMLDAIEAMKE